MLEANLTSRFRALAQAYIAATGRTPLAVWASAAKDGHFLDRVEKGGAFTARSYDKIILWFDMNWPEGAVWPPSVPRPSVPERPSDPRSPECPTGCSDNSPRPGWGARLKRRWEGKRNA